MSVKALSLFLGLALALPSENINAARAAPALTVGMKWDYPLGYTMTSAKASPNIPFYSVDLFDTAASDISAMKANGHYVACYFSAGTREDWRPDANQYPQSAIGKADPDWDDENWVDIRDSQVRTIIANRIALAAQKGCGGIDPDNTDGYSNDSGFPLTQSDAVSLYQFMCSKATAAGMRCGQKNSPEIVPNIVNICSWAIVEQCEEYSECASYHPYIAAGKPVFLVEYDDADDDDDFNTAAACAAGTQQSFSTIIKHLALDKYVYEC